MVLEFTALVQCLHGDSMEILESIRRLLELGFPAIILILLLVLWRAHEKRVDDHIRDLRYIASIRHEAASEAWNGGTLKPRLAREGD